MHPPLQVGIVGGVRPAGRGIDAPLHAIVNRVDACRRRDHFFRVTEGQ